jgi:hypothetical protein
MKCALCAPDSHLLAGARTGSKGGGWEKCTYPEWH